MWTDSRDDAVALMDSPVMEAMESRLLLDVTPEVIALGGKTQYTDFSGNVVTVKLTGGTGTLSLDKETLTGDNLESDLERQWITAISITAVGDNCKLIISVNGKKTTTVINEITVTGGSLKTLKAPKVILAGILVYDDEDNMLVRQQGKLEMSAANGASISLNKLNCATVLLTGTSTKVVSVNVTGSTFFRSSIVAYDTVESAGYGVALKAKKASVNMNSAGLDGKLSTVTAAYFTKINVAGLVGGTLKAHTYDSKDVSLSRLNVRGAIDKTKITAPGTIGNITAHEIRVGTIIEADALNRLNTRGAKANVKKGILASSGDMGATIDLLGTLGKTRTLGSAKIKGSIMGDVTITGDTGSIRARHLLADLTITGNTKVRIQRDVLEEGTSLGKPLIHIGSGSVRGALGTTKVSVPTSFFVSGWSTA